MMNSIQNLFRRNLPAKIMALLGAIILWFFVMNEQNPYVNSNFTVPLYTINEPAGHTVKLSTHDVTIEVRAPRASFTSAKSEEFKAYVDLSEAGDGTTNVKVQTVIPQGFELVDISDETIEVTMESLVEKMLPVDIQIAGNTGAHSALEKIIPEKDYVKLSGPKSNVERVSRVVGFINLANNTADFISKVKLTPFDSTGNVVDSVTLDVAEISVTAKILSGVDKKMVEIRPVYSGAPANKWMVGDVIAQPDKVEITGKTELLETINELSTETVDITGVSKDVIKEVNLVLPEGITTPSKKVTIKVHLKQLN